MLLGIVSLCSFIEISLAFPLSWKTDGVGTGKLSDDQRQRLVNLGYARNIRKLYMTASLAESHLDSGADEEIIKSYQLTWGLPVTGEVDAATSQLINKPRCANADFNIIQTRDRQRRYAIFADGGWTTNNLTYSITAYSSNLTHQEVDRAISRAFKHWTDEANLTITRGDNSSDILLLFARGWHGDDIAFDGPGGIVGHSFLPQPLRPTSGDTHFDDAENWNGLVANPYDNFPPWSSDKHQKREFLDLEQVATHEFGHALGLDHSKDADSVMYPIFTYRENFRLTLDDIEGIRFLYGEPPNGTELSDETDKDVQPAASSAVLYRSFWSTYLRLEIMWFIITFLFV